MFEGVTTLGGRLAVWIATHRYAPLNDAIAFCPIYVGVHYPGDAVALLRLARRPIHDRTLVVARHG
jgi:hypothetical protein